MLDVLPDEFLGAVLRACFEGTNGHPNAAAASTLRLVCNKWRLEMDHRVTRLLLRRWPPARPAAGVHQQWPRVTTVQLGPVPVDRQGRRLEQLLEDLQQLSSLTGLELGWTAIVTQTSPVTTYTPAAGDVNSSSSTGAPRLAAATITLTQPGLPPALGWFTQLQQLRIFKDVGPGVVGDAVEGWHLPAELALLTQLTSLHLEGVVPPRRQLACLPQLQHLHLSGWHTVAKMAVHLRKLPALTHLVLELPREATDKQFLEAVQLAVVVWQQIARRAAHVAQQHQQQQEVGNPVQQEQVVGGPQRPHQLVGPHVTPPGSLAHQFGQQLHLSAPATHSSHHHQQHSSPQPQMVCHAISSTARSGVTAGACYQPLQQLSLLWPFDAGDGYGFGWPGPHRPLVQGPGQSFVEAAAALAGGLTSLELVGLLYRGDVLYSGLEHLTRLRELRLCKHRLSSVTLPWSNLAGLTSLTLDGNQTETMPCYHQGLSCLTNLRQLSLQHNKLCVLPSGLGACTALTSLLLVGNPRLWQLPQELSQLQRLRCLDASNCALTDDIMSLEGPLVGLTGLTSLQLHGNRLRGTPAAALVLPSLHAVSLGGNVFAVTQAAPGFVPGVWGWLQVLQWSGPAPGLACEPSVQRWISSCRWLRELQLQEQDIQVLQPDLGELHHLEVLDLSHNKLTALPPHIGNLTALRHLSLNNNQLTQLPANITQLGCSTSLDVSQNLLEGLPPGMSRLHHLSSLNLNSNRLGALPEEWGSLPALQYLDVGGSVTWGPLPGSWGQPGALPRLRQLTVGRMLQSDGVLVALQQRGVRVLVAGGDQAHSCSHMFAWGL